MVLGHPLPIPFLSLAYKSRLRNLMSQVPPHLHYQFDFVEDLSSLPCKYGVVHGHLLRAPSRTNE
jgi:hypothetical protein